MLKSIGVVVVEPCSSFVFEEYISGALAVLPSELQSLAKVIAVIRFKGGGVCVCIRAS